VQEAKDILLNSNLMGGKKKKKKGKKGKNEKKAPLTRDTISRDPHYQSFWSLLEGLDAAALTLAELKMRKQARNDEKRSKAAKAGGTEKGGICGGCHQAFPNQRMMKCSRCELSYCSKECQVRDWKEGKHKSVCKQRQKDKQEHLNNAGGNKNLAEKAAAFHRKKSRAAQDLLFMRMSDTLTMALVTHGDTVVAKLTDFVFVVELERGYARLLPFDEAVERFDGLNRPTMAILRRNQQRSSALMSALCLVPSHPAMITRAEAPHNIILKSIPKANVAQSLAQMQMLLTVQPDFRENMTGMASQQGMTLEQFADLVAERGMNQAMVGM